MTHRPHLVGAGLLLAGLVACSDGTSPGGNKAQITFNISTSSGAAGLQSLVSDTIADDTDTLIVDQVQLVLRDIRFKRVNDDACDDDDDQGEDNQIVRPASHDDNGDDGNEDACEQVNSGPFLLDLPLGPGVEKVFTVPVDTGTFDELRVKLHKPEDDGEDADFLAAHPEFRKVSIRATGTFNGNPFTFESDLNAQQRMDLVPPLVVTDAGANVDVTLKVDVPAWFTAPGGGVIDPGTANKGGPNDNLVRDNIRDSFHAFRDENHDGEDDDHGHGGNDD